LRNELLLCEPEIFRRLAEEVADDLRGAHVLGGRVLRRGDDRVFLLLRDDALLHETVEELLEPVASLVLARHRRGCRRDGRDQARGGIGTERAQGRRAEQTDAGDAQRARQHELLPQCLHFRQPPCSVLAPATTCLTHPFPKACPSGGQSDRSLHAANILLLPCGFRSRPPRSLPTPRSAASPMSRALCRRPLPRWGTTSLCTCRITGRSTHRSSAFRHPARVPTPSRTAPRAPGSNTPRS